MNPYQKTFIENLKYYRTQKNISQAKLAEMCDCATPTIGCIESARQFPSFELLFKIADALEINPADLFLRNASETILQMKTILKTELIPQIENFVDKRF
ncbi:MAG: helix-turn-helix transcriptional regulator [Spirochaetales bacterium]|nr:helix-turn-helix transcriptional regulator [Spirochaetales bacterium]